MFFAPFGSICARLHRSDTAIGLSLRLAQGAFDAGRLAPSSLSASNRLLCGAGPLVLLLFDARLCIQTTRPMSESLSHSQRTSRWLLHQLTCRSQKALTILPTAYRGAIARLRPSAPDWQAGALRQPASQLSTDHLQRCGQ